MTFGFGSCSVLYGFGFGSWQNLGAGSVRYCWVRFFPISNSTLEYTQTMHSILSCERHNENNNNDRQTETTWTTTTTKQDATNTRERELTTDNDSAVMTTHYTLHTPGHHSTLHTPRQHSTLRTPRQHSTLHTPRQYNTLHTSHTWTIQHITHTLTATRTSGLSDVVSRSSPSYTMPNEPRPISFTSNTWSLVSSQSSHTYAAHSSPCLQVGSDQDEIQTPQCYVINI